MLVEILLIRSKAFQLSTWISQEPFSCKHNAQNKNISYFEKTDRHSQKESYMCFLQYVLYQFFFLKSTQIFQQWNGPQKILDKRVASVLTNQDTMSESNGKYLEEDSVVTKNVYQETNDFLREQKSPFHLTIINSTDQWYFSQTCECPTINACTSNVCYLLKMHHNSLLPSAPLSEAPKMSISQQERRDSCFSKLCWQRELLRFGNFSQQFKAESRDWNMQSENCKKMVSCFKDCACIEFW